MKCHEMPPAVTLFQTASHGADGLQMGVILDTSISAENPDDRLILVTATQILSVGGCVVRCEDFRPRAPWSVPLVAPGRQHADVEAQRCGAIDDPIDVFKVFFIWFGWIVINQRL